MTAQAVPTCSATPLPASQLLLETDFYDAYVTWSPIDAPDTLAFVAKVRNIDLHPGITDLLVQFHWVSRWQQEQWQVHWTNQEQDYAPLGRSGCGLWSLPPKLGLNVGQIAIGRNVPVVTGSIETPVVVSRWDPLSHRWQGHDQTLLLRHSRLSVGPYSMTIIEPLPTLNDGRAVSLPVVSEVVRFCGFNAQYEGVPYFLQAEYLLVTAGQQSCPASYKN